MPIEPFKIVNDDESINQSEYNRCVNFLNQYIDGTVAVYKRSTWADPFEVDLTIDKDATSLIADILKLEDNRLLTAQAYVDLQKLFKGMLERYGSTIHSYGKYLQNSEYFTDGPGYKYDVFSPDETELSVINYSEDLDCYYLNDENHTVLEYNDIPYKTYNDVVPSANFPDLVENPDYISSNISTYPNIYKGYTAGVYSDFQRLSGQYVPSSTLFYYSECNDQLYIAGGQNYQDNRLEEIINCNYNAKVYNKSRPTRGAALAAITTLQSGVESPDKVNAYIPSNLTNTVVNYISPVFFTALNNEDFILL